MPDQTLDEGELAHRASSSPERIRHLVEIGLLRADGEGRFALADAQRVQIVAAYERGGIRLEDLAKAVREGRITFDYSDRIYPEASPPSGRTLSDLIAEIGHGELVGELFTALGLPRPTADRPLTEAEEKVLPAFIEAWAAEGMSAEAPLRAARLLGDATRRATEGWVDLFMEAMDLNPEKRATMSVDALGPRMFEPAVRVAQLLEPLAVWLLRRHMEQALNALNVETMERALEVHGLRPVSGESPAIVFADMSGFTRLTEELGDQLAVRHASTLAQLATLVAEAHSGRLVKQLGDGVMLAFPRSGDAVQAALELRARAEDSGLPPLHTGISAGPVIERDGDYYGRTVNLASRISAVAAPGQVVANQAAADAARGLTPVPLGVTELKGVPAPIQLLRLETPEH
jgi:class 3 adenylate cyclase